MSKRSVQLLIMGILLGSITIQADPMKLWNWDPALQYENSQPIPATDVQTFTLYCNDTAGESGPPYEVSLALDDVGAPPSNEDMAPVVRGRPGSYHCVATQRSSVYGTESGYSNERTFTVAPMDLGYVPAPPVLHPPQNLQ